MKVSEDLTKSLALYVIGGAVAYFGILKPILAKIGVTDSETDRSDEKKGDQAMNPNDNVGKWFNPKTYDAWKAAGFKPGAIILGSSVRNKVDEMVDALSSGGIIYKFDSGKIIAVIASLPSKYAIAQLAKEYQLARGRDLISEINNKLTANVYGTEGAMTRLYNVVNAMSTTGK